MNVLLIIAAVFGAWCLSSIGVVLLIARIRGGLSISLGGNPSTDPHAPSSGEFSGQQISASAVEGGVHPVGHAVADPPSAMSPGAPHLRLVQGGEQR